MKKLEKIGKSVLALSVLANTFMPLGIVHADNNLPASYNVNIVRDGTIELTKHEGENSLEIDVKMGSETKHLTIRASANDKNLDGVTLSCNSNKESCTYTIPTGKDFKFSYVGTDMDIVNQESTPGCIAGMEYIVNHGGSFMVAVPSTEQTTQCVNQTENPNTNNNNNNNNPDPGPSHFDGNAVLVWSCGAGGAKVCYRNFSNTETFYKLSDSEVNYFKASEIEAENISGAKFDVHAKVKFFAPLELFTPKKAAIDNQDSKAVNPEDLVGPPNGDKGGVQYQPLGEPSQNNAFTSYGDRNFKAVIYNDTFKGVSIGSLDDLHYYPQKWTNWFLRTETYDMSGTTREDPVEIDTVLLEKKINLNLQTELNEYEIEKVEAVNAPSNAVTITKKSNGTYDFEFASNFYDKVIFKVTTKDNKEQYILINRRTMDPFIRTGDNNSGVVAEVFFDRETTYEDYDVIGRIVYKDGSSKIVHLKAEKYTDDGLGPISGTYYEIDEEEYNNYPTDAKGRGLKRAMYSYNISKDDLKKIDKIYLNVEIKGSTSTSYAGNFAGSGKGTLIDMANWSMQLYGKEIA